MGGILWMHDDHLQSFAPNDLSDDNVCRLGDQVARLMKNMAEEGSRSRPLAKTHLTCKHDHVSSCAAHQVPFKATVLEKSLIVELLEAEAWF